MENNKKYILGTIIIVVMLAISFIIFNKNNSKKEKITIEKEIVKEEKIVKEENNVEDAKCFVKVEIKGHVIKPGLYEMECDSRIEDVINRAKGLTKDADISVINLGKKIFDEMVIIIYSKNEVKDFIKTQKEEKEKIDKCINNSVIINDGCIDNNNDEIVKTNIKISLNNATLEQLMTLSGIGESKAQSIISYREENNGFKSIDEIKNVSGISEKMFEKIKDSIEL